MYSNIKKYKEVVNCEWNIGHYQLTVITNREQQNSHGPNLLFVKQEQQYRMNNNIIYRIELKRLLLSFLEP